jgi:predicted dehydrogenase
MPLRIGIVGTDTSHAEAFPRILLGKKLDGGAFADVRITRFWTDGKHEGRIKYLTGIGAERVHGPPELMLGAVDAVLLELVKGDTHLEAAAPFIKAKVPLFIDKPFAGSWDHAKKLAALIREHGAPVQSGSSLRFAPETADLLTKIAGQKVASWLFTGPNPGGFYDYGNHTVELALGALGGRNSAVGVKWAFDGGTGNDDVLQLGLPDGKVATVVATESPKPGFAAAAVTDKGLHTRAYDNKIGGGWYYALMTEVIRFFETGKPTLPLDAVMEVMKIIEAAERSKKSGTKVELASVE